MTELERVLEDNPGCTLLLDNDMFWVMKTMDTGDDHWSDVKGNELYKGDGPPEQELISALASLNGMKVEQV